jgi:hypothetical protein
MVKLVDPERLRQFDRRQREIIDEVNAWGYMEIGLCHNNAPLYRGRRLLDVGMGGGPCSVAYIVGGAESYAGVDPTVGTDSVYDPRARDDPRRKKYSAFPFTPDDIMRAFPNIRLFSGYMEDFTDELKALNCNLITLQSVSEHLQRPDAAFKSAYDATTKDAEIWLNHNNYYSWSGHHRPPREVRQYDPKNKVHLRNADWNHLDPKHPAYAAPNLNRMRLKDFKLLIDKYFVIYQWRENYDAVERLTPAIRQKYKAFSLDDLLSRASLVFARKRARPKNMDLSRLSLFHPDESYCANMDFGSESDAKIRESNLVFIARPGVISSHSYNAWAGARIMNALQVGDKITVCKHRRKLNLTVTKTKPCKEGARAHFADAIPEDIFDEDRSSWSLTNWPRRP